MPDITKILSAVEEGDRRAADVLLPIVYQELRRLASVRLQNEPAGQTLQPTALVHEAYVRLVDVEQRQKWDSRGHFFSAAAEAMRRILVDRARRKARPKHGGDLKRVQIDEQCTARDDEKTSELLDVHDALSVLEHEDPNKAELVKLRYFAGMSLVEAAAAMNVSRATASRDWKIAKAKLSCVLQDLRE